MVGSEVASRVLKASDRYEETLTVMTGPSAAARLRRPKGTSDHNDRAVRETALRDPIPLLPPGPAAALSSRNETASQFRG